LGRALVTPFGERPAAALRRLALGASGRPASNGLEPAWLARYRANAPRKRVQPTSNINSPAE
jgi:hypothetical protein